MPQSLSSLVGREYADILHLMSGEEILQLARYVDQELPALQVSMALWNSDLLRKLESFQAVEQRKLTRREQKKRVEFDLPDSFLPRPKLREVCAAASIVVEHLTPVAEVPASAVDEFLAAEL